ncbi:MAG: transcription antitermination factor NusB [Hyphomicrobiaceae bacterium]
MSEQGPSNKPTGSRTKPNRSASRTGAVQALYQMDLVKTDLNAVIEEFVAHRFQGGDDDNPIKGADPVFFAEILRGVVRLQRDIDPDIDNQLAKGWRLVRVDSILRAILRAGSFELLERPDVPARVVINEYIEVAHAFFDGEEPKVVNGVLDRIARRVRESEFHDKPPGAVNG